MEVGCLPLKVLDPVNIDAMPHERNAMLGQERVSRDAMPHGRNVIEKTTQGQLVGLQLEVL
jgi:hypothetical protein